MRAIIKRYWLIPISLLLTGCAIVFILLNACSGTNVPGAPVRDNISEIFTIKNKHYYVTFGGTLFSIADGKKIATFPHGRIKWVENLSLFFYIDSDSLYKWSFTEGGTICVKIDVGSNPMLYAVTDSYAIIRDSNFSLYRVSLDGYQISKLLDRDPGEIITCSNDNLFIQSSDYNTIYELDCRSYVSKELVNDRSSDDPIIFASVHDGNLYYLRNKSNELFSCRTSLSPITMNEICLPYGIPGKKTIGFAFINEDIFIARSDEANIYLCSIPESNYMNTNISVLVNKTDLIYLIPGTFMISTSLDSYCYAVRTSDKVAFGEI